MPVQTIFHLRSLVRNVATASDSADPDVVAQEVLAEISAAEMKSALEQAMPIVVQAVLSRSRGPILVPGAAQGASVTHSRSGTVEYQTRNVRRIREAWQRQLKERLRVGPRDYKFFGDCTADDLDAAATLREAHARATQENAARLREIAALLGTHNVTTVRELPASILGDLP